MSQLISPLLTAFIIIIFDFQGPTGPNFTSLPTKLIYAHLMAYNGELFARN